MSKRMFVLLLMVCLWVTYWWLTSPEHEPVHQPASPPTPPQVRVITTIITPQAATIFGMGAVPATPSPPQSVTAMTDTLVLSGSVIQK